MTLEWFWPGINCAELRSSEDVPAHVRGVGLDDLKGPFHPKTFCDLMILWNSPQNQIKDRPWHCSFYQDKCPGIRKLLEESPSSAIGYLLHHGLRLHFLKLCSEEVAVGSLRI